MIKVQTDLGAVFSSADATDWMLMKCDEDILLEDYRLEAPSSPRSSHWYIPMCTLGPLWAGGGVGTANYIGSALLSRILCLWFGRNYRYNRPNWWMTDGKMKENDVCKCAWCSNGVYNLQTVVMRRALAPNNIWANLNLSQALFLACLTQPLKPISPVSHFLNLFPLSTSCLARQFDSTQEATNWKTAGNYIKFCSIVFQDPYVHFLIL